jgi:hypothetical protein
MSRRRKPLEGGPGAFVREEAPWPYLTLKAASRMLNVSTAFLSGLANQNGRLRSVKLPTLHGNFVQVFNKEDVEQLRPVIAEARTSARTSAVTS